GARVLELDRGVEALDLAVLDRHAAVPRGVVDPVVAVAVDHVGAGEATPLDQVTAEIDRDAARPDHEAVAGAGPEVAFQGRVLRDHLAAVDRGRERLAGGKDQQHGCGKRRDGRAKKSAHRASPPWIDPLAAYR